MFFKQSYSNLKIGFVLEIDYLVIFTFVPYQFVACIYMFSKSVILQGYIISLLLLKWITLSTIIQVHITHRHIYLTTWIHMVIVTDTVASQWPSVNSFLKFSIRLFLYHLSIL